MQYGICNLSLVPLRKYPEHSAEMASQLLFGESFDILDHHENWLHIQLHIDEYTGWIHQRQYLALSKGALDEIHNVSKVLSCDLFSMLIEKSTENTFPLLMGSSIPMPVDNAFHFANENYHYKGNYISPAAKKEDILRFAAIYMGAPYLWGGRSHFGIDCSGFSQMAYHLAGFTLPRDASQQALVGETLSFLSEAEPGDLLFFDNAEGNIIHVGIYFGNHKIIHASGNVRMDTIDHQGIFNENMQQYTHQLRLVKRMVS
jgi:hypothetical protein